MELPKPPSNLNSLACFFFLLSITIHQSLSARTLGGLPSPPQPSPGRSHHHRHKTITFYMPNVLNSDLQRPSTTPPTTKINGQHIPFSNPSGFYPPVGGIPNPDSNSIPSQTFGLYGIGSDLGSTILQEELEFGMAKVIDVDLLERTKMYGLTSLGKAKGMYVSSLGNESSKMMAMTTSFLDNEFKDELRFFGVHRADVNSESHITVIGGKGKYDGANGYATIKTVKLDSKNVQKSEEENIFLLVDVYLG